MGCAQSSKADRLAKARNDDIEDQLKRDLANSRKEIKILLLGASASGKSTILKQMKLIHHGSCTKQERDSYKRIIYSNIVESMRAILEALPFLSIGIDPSNDGRRGIIMGRPAEIEGETLHPDIADAVRGLWNDPNIREAVRRSREFQLIDSAVYYFDSIDRIAHPRYVPSDQDILRSRAKAPFITEVTFIKRDLKYRIFDLGRSPSNEKKWIHYFDNVDALIFLVPLGAYDEMLNGDRSFNRMQGELALFDSICNSRRFVRTPIFLFFNKIDLFAQKLPVTPLSDFFPDYTGGTDYACACNYFERRFMSLDRTASKQIYVHYTCGIDTEQISSVLDAIQDTIRSYPHNFGFS